MSKTNKKGEMCAACLKACAECYAKHQWINVKDRLPQKNELVLVADKKGTVCSAKISEDGYPTANSLMLYKPTHWMLLPEPPK